MQKGTIRKPIFFVKFSLFFLLVSFLLLPSGCKKDEDSLSKTDLLCKTWLWESDRNDVLMRFQSDGTAVLNDGDTGTFQYLWKWDKDETLLVITSVRSGKVEKYIVASVSDKELVLKEETGTQQITIHAA